MIVLVRVQNILQSWRNWRCRWYSDHFDVSESAPMMSAPFLPSTVKLRKTVFVQACINMSKNLQLCWNT